MSSDERRGFSGGEFSLSQVINYGSGNVKPVSILWFLGCLFFFFGWVLLAIYGYRLLINNKANVTKKLITASASKDPTWNLDELVRFVNQEFLFFQDARMNQDMDVMEGKMSDILRQQYQLFLNKQKNAYIYNFMSQIEVESIKIIGFSDCINNDNDMFSAYISGRMVDEIVRTGFVPSGTAKATSFEDIYTFKRVENSWIIIGVSDKMNYNDIAQHQNFVE